jgi:hypothetical protein
MTVGAALVRYAILVAVLGPAALCRAIWPLRARGWVPPSDSPPPIALR